MLTPELDAERIAYALGKVIARKSLGAEPSFQRMDGLAKVSAVHTLATRITADLGDEVDAVVDEVRRQLTLAEAANA